MSNNPLLSAIQLPGKPFTLPSNGLLYTNEVSDAVQNGEVHARPISALSEIKLKNPDLLFTGQGFDEVCKTHIPEINDPMSLYAKDVDALMLFLRIVTYGNDFDVIAEHTCENAISHTYSVDLNEIVGKMVYLDPTTIDDDRTIKLKSTGQTVKILPMRFRDIVEIMQLEVKAGDIPTQDDLENAFIKHTSKFIESVDGHDDQNMIEEWMSKIPSAAARELTTEIEKFNSWGPDFTYEAECPDCGDKFLIELPTNPISFFTD